MKCGTWTAAQRRAHLETSVVRIVGELTGVLGKGIDRLHRAQTKAEEDKQVNKGI